MNVPVDESHERFVSYKWLLITRHLGGFIYLAKYLSRSFHDTSLLLRARLKFQGLNRIYNLFEDYKKKYFTVVFCVKSDLLKKNVLNRIPTDMMYDGELKFLFQSVRFLLHEFPAFSEYLNSNEFLSLD